jgi:hypothetical protein
VGDGLELYGEYGGRDVRGRARRLGAQRCVRLGFGDGLELGDWWVWSLVGHWWVNVGDEEEPGREEFERRRQGRAARTRKKRDEAAACTGGRTTRVAGF